MPPAPWQRLPVHANFLARSSLEKAATSQRSTAARDGESHERTYAENERLEAKCLPCAGAAEAIAGRRHYSGSRDPRGTVLLSPPTQDLERFRRSIGPDYPPGPRGLPPWAGRPRARLGSGH